MPTRERLLDEPRAKRRAIQGLSLTEVEALYGSLVETLPAIVYVAEPSPPYATIYVSPCIESLGFTLEEWLEKPDSWVSILHPEDRERVLAQTEEALQARKEHDFEYRVLAKDGTVHWLHDRGRFVYDRLDGPIRWQGVLFDITRRKKAEEEREAVIQQLQKAVAELDAMRAERTPDATRAHGLT